MAKLEIEIDDATGQPTNLPDALKKHVDGLVDKGFKARHAELRTTIQKELSGDAVDKEELVRLKKEADERKAADLERDKKYDEAKAAREQRHQADLEQKNAEITKRDGRLRDFARNEVKIAAKVLGARNESLDELARLLGADIDLDADLSPFVKGTDGKPAAGQDGKPVTIEGHVKAYLDTHPHHVNATAGTGGGAGGGASTQHLSTEARAAQAKVEAIQKRIAERGSSDADVADLFEATRALKKAQAGGK